jgi:ribose transport system ATP-binding protein
VGVTGTIDSGILDLPSLLGAVRPAHGRIRVGPYDLDLARSSVADLLRSEVVMIPQDRHGQGLATGLTVEENVTIPHIGTRARPWSLGTAWRQQETDYVLERYDVRPRGRDTVVATLSGGNQQKVMFGKWLLAKPRVLTLDEPTQGWTSAPGLLSSRPPVKPRRRAPRCSTSHRRSKTWRPSATDCSSSRTGRLRAT